MDMIDKLEQNTKRDRVQTTREEKTDSAFIIPFGDGSATFTGTTVSSTGFFASGT